MVKHEGSEAQPSMMYTEKQLQHTKLSPIDVILYRLRYEAEQSLTAQDEIIYHVNNEVDNNIKPEPVDKCERESQHVNQIEEYKQSRDIFHGVEETEKSNEQHLSFMQHVISTDGDSKKVKSIGECTTKVEVKLPLTSNDHGSEIFMALDIPEPEIDIQLKGEEGEGFDKPKNNDTCKTVCDIDIPQHKEKSIQREPQSDKSRNHKRTCDDERTTDSKRKRFKNNLGTDKVVHPKEKSKTRVKHQINKCNKDIKLIKQKRNNIDIVNYSKLKDEYGMSVCISASSKSDISCSLCRKIFKNKKRLERHTALGKCDTLLKSVTDDKKGKVIDEVMPKKDVDEHMSNRTDKNACKLCERSFVTKANLVQHILWHKRQSKERCGNNSIIETENNNCNLAIIDQTHAPSKTSTQELDDETVKNSQCNGKFQCEIYFQTFHTINTFKKHLSTHSTDPNDRPFGCSYCNKTYACKNILKQHIRRCHSGRSIFCKYCNASFQTNSGLRKHVENFHEKNCDNMRNNENPNIREHICTICDITFYTNYNLRRHMMTHNSIKPFQCATCERRFKCKYVLDKHMARAHSEDRPFVCLICSKKFKTKTNLLQHSKKMHNERNLKEFPYPCQNCKLMCKTKEELDKHLSLPLYECDVCNKHYTTFSGMKNHKQLRHVDDHPDLVPEPQYSCPICNNKFMHQCTLRRHLNTLHQSDK